MASWSTIKGLAIFFAPLLLPKALAYWRSIRNAPPSQIRPLSQSTSHALTLLFAAACIALLSTLPLRTPANIFALTNSHLQTSTPALRARLGTHHTLTPSDELLLTTLSSLDARLLYARFGPDILTSIPIASPTDDDANMTYLIYALPSLLAPHLLHLLALGLATSAFFRTSRWRPIATTAALVLAAAEVAYIATYDSTHNARVRRLQDTDFVYWKMPLYRGLAFTAVDALLGWAIWLQATQRAFLAPPTAGERIADTSQTLEAVLGVARGLGIVRNGVSRNRQLRGKVEGYWVKEGEVMGDVFEDGEVLAAQRSVLAKRDVAAVSREADAYLEGLLSMMARS